ncbi:MAG: DUF1214 domain-containing protein [Deltaproteobacteria bacterium]|nr:DUF1214 domain-containing protein [Deltaproteobacteria bacterium]
MRRLLIFFASLYKAVKRFSQKLRGATPLTDADRRIVSGQTWDDFCDTLKAAGANIMAHNNQDSRTMAEGYRYLSRLARGGLEAFVEYADPLAPVLRCMVHETVKMGADNPDNYYQNAVISGRYEYRITGNRGSVHFLTFSTQKGGYGQGGDLPPSGFLDSKSLITGPDGELEIILSTKQHEGNWLKMDEDSGMVMVRQTFLDSKTEKRAELKIERIGGDGLPLTVTGKSIDDGLMSASNLVAGASLLFSKWTSDFMKHTNRLPLFDEKKSTKAGGDPNIAYYHSYWKIEENEVMVITATPPPCEHWNFQLNNHWMESLDYRYYPIHINKHTAKINSDGTVTVVVSHVNPGVENWLSTTGHTRGTMCWRWIRSDSRPEPSVEIVPLTALKKGALQND